MSIDSSLKAIKYNTRLLYGKGFEDGKNSVDNLLEYATSLYEAYSSAVFPEGYEMTINVPNIKSFYSAFNSAKGIKKIVIKGNTAGNSISFNRAFRSCQSLETIDFTEFNAKFKGDMTMAFYSSNIVEILGELDFTEVTTFNNFVLCGTLVTFTPKANSIKNSINFSSCPKLSNASKQAIFDGLATVETAKTLTLISSLKILQSQVDSANAKGWTVAGGKVVSEEEYYG